MKKLKELIKKTKCSIYIEINNHRNLHETIEQHIPYKYRDDINIDVWNKMIETDTCVMLCFYPDTPIGFYVIYHYDVEESIVIALNEY